MNPAKFDKKMKCLLAFWGIVCIPGVLLAQHRGDNLRFQGADFVNRNGTRALAMGGAFTAASGELDALFWNPAGLVGIKGLRLAANFSSLEQTWRERQDYRPNRQLVTMSFILDGLYRPNPAFNGWLDNDAFLNDSTYIVHEPELGKDGYSKETADWQKILDDSGLNNFAAAYAFVLANRPAVVSAGYSRQSVANYDRNQTDLTPHPAWDGYGDLPPRVTGATDSVRINWSDYERERTGPLRSITAAVAYGIHKNLDLGISIDRMTGKTSDLQANRRIGFFDLVQGIQIFRFSYDTLDVVTTGISDFSATSFRLGATAHFARFSLGASITPRHTIKRSWNDLTTTRTADNAGSQENSGEDELGVPFSFSVGLSLTPHNKFRLAFDLEHRPYTKAKFRLAQADPTLRPWANQTSFRFGVEYQLFDRLSLLGGYRNIPQVFIPDGAADLQKGPIAEIYTLGASAVSPFGRFDFVYEYRQLKYYDVYFSNTNWAFESLANFRVGYTFTLSP